MQYIIVGARTAVRGLELRLPAKDFVASAAEVRALPDYFARLVGWPSEDGEYLIRSPASYLPMVTEAAPVATRLAAMRHLQAMRTTLGSATVLHLLTQCLWAAATQPDAGIDKRTDLVQCLVGLMRLAWSMGTVDTNVDKLVATVRDPRRQQMVGDPDVVALQLELGQRATPDVLADLLAVVAFCQFRDAQTLPGVARVLTVQPAALQIDFAEWARRLQQALAQPALLLALLRLDSSDPQATADVMDQVQTRSLEVLVARCGGSHVLLGDARLPLPWPLVCLTMEYLGIGATARARIPIPPLAASSTSLSSSSTGLRKSPANSWAGVVARATWTTRSGKVRAPPSAEVATEGSSKDPLQDNSSLPEPGEHDRQLLGELLAVGLHHAIRVPDLARALPWAERCRDQLPALPRSAGYVARIEAAEQARAFYEQRSEWTTRVNTARAAADAAAKAAARATFELGRLIGRRPQNCVALVCAGCGDPYPVHRGIETDPEALTAVGLSPSHCPGCVRAGLDKKECKECTAAARLPSHCPAHKYTTSTRCDQCTQAWQQRARCGRCRELRAQAHVAVDRIVCRRGRWRSYTCTTCPGPFTYYVQANKPPAEAARCAWCRRGLQNPLLGGPFAIEHDDVTRAQTAKAVAAAAAKVRADADTQRLHSDAEREQAGLRDLCKRFPTDHHPDHEDLGHDEHEQHEGGDHGDDPHGEPTADRRGRRPGHRDGHGKSTNRRSSRQNDGHGKSADRRRRPSRDDSHTQSTDRRSHGRPEHRRHRRDRDPEARHKHPEADHDAGHEHGGDHKDPVMAKPQRPGCRVCREPSAVTVAFDATVGVRVCQACNERLVPTLLADWDAQVAAAGRDVALRPDVTFPKLLSQDEYAATASRRARLYGVSPVDYLGRQEVSFDRVVPWLVDFLSGPEHQVLAEYHRIASGSPSGGSGPEHTMVTRFVARDRPRCPGCDPKRTVVCPHCWYRAVLTVKDVTDGKDGHDKLVIITYPGYEPAPANQCHENELYRKTLSKDVGLAGDQNIRVFLWSQLALLAGEVGTAEL